MVGLENIHFEEMKKWVRFDDADSLRLRSVLPVVEPHIGRIIDLFYDEIQRHPESDSVLEGPAQVERLKGSLRRWLNEVFVGPHDDVYASLRRKIGRRHVQVGLPDRYMFTAMHLIEHEVAELLCAHLKDPWPAIQSLRRICTLDLALMTGTYVKSRERLQLDSLHSLLVQHLRLTVLMVDDDGVVQSATDATSQLMVGDSVRGRHWQQALPPGLLNAASLQDHVDRALSTDREVTLPRVDVEGIERRSYRIHVVPLSHVLAAFLIQIEELTDAVDMEARLRRSEALAQLGALSAAVAHELRNPLAGISGALQVITNSMNENEPHARILGKVEGEVRRLNGLVTDLLAFARPGSATLGPVDLRAVADSVVELLDPSELTLEVVGEGRAQGDANLIRQILHNLLRNAEDAAGPNGHIRLTISPSTIAISDSGSGVQDADRERIFEPFMTTKTRGTGLGLAICTRSADAMSGRLTLTEGPLSGATFELRLLAL
jgi:signal transduction histidine kinase